MRTAYLVLRKGSRLPQAVERAPGAANTTSGRGHKGGPEGRGPGSGQGQGPGPGGPPGQNGTGAGGGDTVEDVPNPTLLCPDCGTKRSADMILEVEPGVWRCGNCKRKREEGS